MVELTQKKHASYILSTDTKTDSGIALYQQNI